MHSKENYKRWETPNRSKFKFKHYGHTMNLRLHRDSCVFLNTAEKTENSVVWTNPFKDSKIAETKISSTSALPSYVGYELFLALMHLVTQNATRKDSKKLLKDSDLLVQSRFLDLGATTNFYISASTAKKRYTEELQALKDTTLYFDNKESFRFIKEFNTIDVRGSAIVKFHSDVKELYVKQSVYANLQKFHELRATSGKPRVLAFAAYVSSYKKQKGKDQRFYVSATQLYDNFGFKDNRQKIALGRFIKGISEFLAKELHVEIVAHRKIFQQGELEQIYEIRDL